MHSYWGYVRVSVLGDRGGESFISPDEQKRKIEGWAQMKGVQIAGFEEDINVSGGKKSRPGLDRILERLELGQADGIVVSNLDRLSRLGVSDALELIDRIQGFGADIAILEPSIDTTDPVTGEFVLTLFLALNRMERQRAKIRWQEAAENAIGRDIHTGPSPFGYMRPNEYDEEGNKLPREMRDQKTGDRRLIPHPAEAPVVKEMFKRRAAGETWGEIARWVNGAGVKTPYGKTWGTKDIKQVINRRTYLGVAFYGKYEKQDAHEALVDPVTWEAAQTRRGSRGSDSGGLLRGLVRCANCRYTMQYMKKTQPSANGSNPIYACVRGKAEYGGKCDQPTTVVGPDSASGARMKPIHGIENAVVDAVFKKLEGFEFRAVGDSSAVEELDDEIARIEHDLNAYLSDTELQEAVGRDHYLAGAKERQLALDDLREQRRQALKEAYQPLNGKSVRRLREDWEQMELGEKREILASLIQAVFIRKSDGGAWWGSDDRWFIVWRDDPEVDIPRQGRRDWVTKPFVFPTVDADPVDAGVAGSEPT